MRRTTRWLAAAALVASFVAATPASSASAIASGPAIPGVPTVRGISTQQLHAVQHDLALLGHPVPSTGRLDRLTSDALAWVAHKYGWRYAGVVTPSMADAVHRYAVRALHGPTACRIAASLLMCVDEKLLLLLVVRNGRIVSRLDVRLSGAASTDRVGRFHVYLRARTKWSTEFSAWMYDVLLFDGGRAIHYSPAFARAGYTGGSQGCVNVRDRPAMDRLFATVPVGTVVVVTP